MGKPAYNINLQTSPFSVCIRLPYICCSFIVDKNLKQMTLLFCIQKYVRRETHQLSMNQIAKSVCLIIRSLIHTHFLLLRFPEYNLYELYFEEYNLFKLISPHLPNTHLLTIPSNWASRTKRAYRNADVLAELDK